MAVNKIITKSPAGYVPKMENYFHDTGERPERQDYLIPVLEIRKKREKRLPQVAFSHTEVKPLLTMIAQLQQSWEDLRFMTKTQEAVFNELYKSNRKLSPTSLAKRLGKNEKVVAKCCDILERRGFIYKSSEKTYLLCKHKRRLEDCNRQIKKRKVKKNG